MDRRKFLQQAGVATIIPCCAFPSNSMEAANVTTDPKLPKPPRATDFKSVEEYCKSLIYDGTKRMKRRIERYHSPVFSGKILPINYKPTDMHLIATYVDASLNYINRHDIIARMFDCMADRLCEKIEQEEYKRPVLANLSIYYDPCIYKQRKFGYYCWLEFHQPRKNNVI